jgi:hypothetical protein
VGGDGSGLDELLDHRRRLAAKQRFGTAGKDSAKPSLVAADGQRMGDIHAVMNGMETTTLQTRLDRLAAHACSEKLRGRDQLQLTAGDDLDLPLGSRFSLYARGFLPPSSHARHVGSENRACGAAPSPLCR